MEGCDGIIRDSQTGEVYEEEKVWSEGSRIIFIRRRKVHQNYTILRGVLMRLEAVQFPESKMLDIITRVLAE